LKVPVQCKVCGHNNPHEARFCGNCGATLTTTVEPSPPLLDKSDVVTPGVSPVPPWVAAEYAGFWIRFGAGIVDAVVVWLIFMALRSLNFLFPVFLYLPSLLFVLLYYWLLTGLKGQTLGKMAVGIKVVNVQGDKPGLGVAALREILGKFISAFTFCLGFFWIAGDPKKQGWHDKIGSTYVIKVSKAKSRE